MGWDFIFGPPRLSIDFSHHPKIVCQTPNFPFQQVDPPGLVDDNLIQVMNGALQMREKGFQFGETRFWRWLWTVHSPILERFRRR